VPVAIDDAFGSIEIRVGGGIGGVEATLESSAGDGAFYGTGGVVDPALLRFLPAPTPSPPQAVGKVPNVVRHATFVNVPEGEYELVYAREGVACRAPGWLNGDVVFGFPSEKLNTLRVPVLTGAFTPRIKLDCACLIVYEAGFGNVGTSCEVLGAGAGPGDGGSVLPADAGSD
jgi:hypothetical protein